MKHHRKLAAVLIVIAAVRIALTYRVFSDTADEANHVGAGLDLYQNHRYVVQLANPPLPRLVLAAAPRLGGMRRDMSVDFSAQLRSVFEHGKYERDLVLARVGNLVFFVIAAIGVWLLARRVLDETAALLALALFTTQPVVLGFAGLATHDIAAVAGTAVALLAFVRWLRAPSLTGAVIVGLALGFGALCKFSCIVFVPAASATLLFVRLFHDQALRAKVWKALAELLVVPFVAFATLWAGYLFSIGQVGRFKHVPAPDFFNGMAELLVLEREGFLSYALGHYSMRGWWWYFPLAFALKTTLGLLLLLIAGAWFARREPALRWPFVEWTLAAFAIMAPTLPSALDLGVRYILPVYIAFSIAVAAAAMAMLRSPRRVVQAAAVALLAWHLVASTVAHPDYFTYFNEIAARQPSRYLIDSNLDWGQDLLRLARFCRKHHINELAYNLFSASDPNRIGLPPKLEINWRLPPSVPTALSESAIVLTRITYPGAYPWADEVPYVRVGKSIRVYHVMRDP